MYSLLPLSLSSSLHFSLRLSLCLSPPRPPPPSSASLLSPLRSRTIFDDDLVVAVVHAEADVDHGVEGEVVHHATRLPHGRQCLERPVDAWSTSTTRSSDTRTGTIRSTPTLTTRRARHRTRTRCKLALEPCKLARQGSPAARNGGRKARLAEEQAARGVVPAAEEVQGRDRGEVSPVVEPGDQDLEGAATTGVVGGVVRVRGGSRYETSSSERGKRGATKRHGACYPGSLPSVRFSVTL